MERINIQFGVDLTHTSGHTPEDSTTAPSSTPEGILESTVQNIIDSQSDAANFGCTFQGATVNSRSTLALLQLRRLQDETTSWQISATLECSSTDVSQLRADLEDPEWWRERLSTESVLTDYYTIAVSGATTELSEVTPAPAPVPAPDLPQPTAQPQPANMTPLFIAAFVIVVVGVAAVVGGWMGGNRLDGTDPKGRGSVLEMGGVGGSS